MASQRCNARELRLALGGDGCGSPPGLQAALFLRVVSCPCACWPVRHAFVPSTHSCAHPRPHQEQRRQQRLQRCSSARRHGALRCEAVAGERDAALPGVGRRGDRNWREQLADLLDVIAIPTLLHIVGRQADGGSIFEFGERGPQEQIDAEEAKDEYIALANGPCRSNRVAAQQRTPSDRTGETRQPLNAERPSRNRRTKHAKPKTRQPIKYGLKRNVDGQPCKPEQKRHRRHDDERIQQQPAMQGKPPEASPATKPMRSRGRHREIPAAALDPKCSFACNPDIQPSDVFEPAIDFAYVPSEENEANVGTNVLHRDMLSRLALRAHGYQGNRCAVEPLHPRLGPTPSQVRADTNNGTDSAPTPRPTDKPNRNRPEPLHPRLGPKPSQVRAQAEGATATRPAAVSAERSITDSR